MKNFLFILLIAVLTLVALLFFTNPGLLDDIWLWLVGFAGHIIAFFKRIGDWVAGIFKKEKENTVEKKPIESPQQQPEQILTIEKKIEKIESALKQGSTTPVLPEFDGATLTVLRYLDDEETTLGMLFLRNQFIAYTLEDTHQDEKIKGQTRIPAGVYAVDFLKQETGLTRKYRSRFSWFNFHLEIKEIPNFKNVYIHIGNNAANTDGCLLVADGVNAASVQKTITSSTQAYKRLYLRLSDLLKSGEKLRINIQDEGWFKNAGLQNL